VEVKDVINLLAYVRKV
jgi:hypothetical protein